MGTHISGLPIHDGEIVCPGAAAQHWVELCYRCRWFGGRMRLSGGDVVVCTAEEAGVGPGRVVDVPGQYLG